MYYLSLHFLPCEILDTLNPFKPLKILKIRKILEIVQHSKPLRMGKPGYFHLRRLLEVPKISKPLNTFTFFRLLKILKNKFNNDHTKAITCNKGT